MEGKRKLHTQRFSVSLRNIEPSAATHEQIIPIAEKKNGWFYLKGSRVWRTKARLTAIEQSLCVLPLNINDKICLTLLYGAIREMARGLL